MKKILHMVYAQHVLHIRWVVSQFVPLSPSVIGIGRWFVFIWPILLTLLIYYVCRGVFYYLLAKNAVPSLEAIQDFLTVFYAYLFFRGASNDYRTVYLRAFFSGDMAMLIGYGWRPFYIQLSKLVDVYFLPIYFVIYPVLLGGILAAHFVLDIKISISWITTDLLLVILSALLLRMCLMTLFFFLRKSVHGAQEVCKPTYFIKRLIVWATLAGFGYISVNFFVSWYGGTFSLDVLWLTFSKAIRSRVLEYLPTYRLLVDHMNWGWILFLSAGIFSLTLFHFFYEETIMQDRLGHNQTSGKHIAWFDRGIRLLERKGDKQWRMLLYKDLILLRRDYRLVLPQLNIVLSILALLVGSAISFRQMGYFTSVAASFSGVFVTQLILAGIIASVVSRVTSIDAEGSMISVLMLNLKSPTQLLLPKAVMHFVFVYSFVTLVTLLFSVITNLPALQLLFVLVSGFLVSVVSSLSFILSSAMYPRFNWEDESRIGTSSKASFVESLILRAYEVLIVTVLGSSGVYLYVDRITQNTFFTLSLLGITVISLVWIGVLSYLFKYPFWKRWRIGS